MKRVSLLFLIAIDRYNKFLRISYKGYIDDRRYTLTYHRLQRALSSRFGLAKEARCSLLIPHPQRTTPRSACRARCVCRVSRPRQHSRRAESLTAGRVRDVFHQTTLSLSAGQTEAEGAVNGENKGSVVRAGFTYAIFTSPHTVHGRRLP